MFKLMLVSLLAASSALAPAPKVAAPKIAAAKPQYRLAAAATAFAPLAAFAGGQSEGTGLPLGVDDGREGIALSCVFLGMFSVYYNWAKDQPDSDGSDFFAEYEERRFE
eukprot:CAMPEP_0119266380 /NCGR_PEP_ID=MMETSP1329-20130426/4889_1 /TAXON_ID=114041 /ORGANISM="Genus nov. species nov., Strain RCC1024" /LENGTH=108 /DNA_ID=CAMNT_0007266257 /DNA_START=114 /DNA_END=440 /DNA_ORIENTATION=+